MRRIVLGLSLLVFLVAAAGASACACCADRGEWHENAQKVGAFELGELDRVRFAPLARTFVGPGGLETIRGISSPAAAYRLSLVHAGRRWTLAFRAKGSSGTLAFNVPATAVFFGADLGDGKQGSGGGPLLYTELRLTTPGAGGGAFAGGTARLILQGRGNNCLNADAFTRWILQVNGPRARYSLSGRLLRAAT